MFGGFRNWTEKKFNNCRAEQNQIGDMIYRYNTDRLLELTYPLERVPNHSKDSLSGVACFCSPEEVKYTKEEA